MQSPITRLALSQFLAVIYSIFGVGTWTKMARTAGSPGAFAGLAHDYGFLLLLLPAVWLITASVEAHRPKRNTGDVNLIFTSGVCLLGLLIVIGFFAIMSAIRPLTHVAYNLPQPTPAPARISRVME